VVPRIDWSSIASIPWRLRSASRLDRHDQDGAGRVLDDLLGDAAEQRVTETVSPLTTHDDQTRVIARTPARKAVADDSEKSVGTKISLRPSKFLLTSCHASATNEGPPQRAACIWPVLVVLLCRRGHPTRRSAAHVLRHLALRPQPLRVMAPSDSPSIRESRCADDSSMTATP
jgi:hypothetical protein